jgi:hypothetical protein
MGRRVREVRRVRKTIFIVCEGKTDLGFLYYLKRTYCSGRSDAPEMAFKQSYGKGGNQVVDVLLRQLNYKDYDVRVALTEADAPPTAASLKALSGARGRHLVVAPCIEGLLLDVLGEPVPQLSADCKARVAVIERRDLSEPASYGQLWPRACLDGARGNIAVLRALLDLFE